MPQQVPVNWVLFCMGPIFRLHGNEPNIQLYSCRLSMVIFAHTWSVCSLVYFYVFFLFIYFLLSVYVIAMQLTFHFLCKKLMTKLISIACSLLFSIYTVMQGNTCKVILPFFSLKPSSPSCGWLQLNGSESHPYPVVWHLSDDARWVEFSICSVRKCRVSELGIWLGRKKAPLCYTYKQIKAMVTGYSVFQTLLPFSSSPFPAY